MANRAFVILGSSGMAPGPDRDPNTGDYLGFQLDVRYIVLNDSNQVVSNNSTGAQSLGYGDNAQSIHQAIADAVRTHESDPSLVVRFVDSPGNY